VIDSQFLLDSPVLNGPRDEELEALVASEDRGTAAQWDRYARRHDSRFWNATFTFYGPELVVDARWAYVVQRYSAIPGVQFADGTTYRFPMGAEERERAADKAHLGIPSLADFGERTITRYGAADGHVDFAVVVPMNGADVLDALKVIGRALAEADVGASLGTMSSFHPRTLLLVSSFPTWRDNREANGLVRAAYERVVKLAAEHGWGQYRAHAGFMDLAMSTYSVNDNALSRFHATLKDALDPAGVLSAGRYGIWPKHLRKDE
jgi:4-cresol dehydrogenase (hydroxylating)